MDVSIKPSLEWLSEEQLNGMEHHAVNKEDWAWLDVAPNVFWETNKERAFFDIRVFKLYAPHSNQLTKCLVKEVLRKE